MTIIVLEGVNGVGKSSAARALVQRGGGVVYRAFRRDDHHFDGSSRLERELQRLDIPVNTHVEDYFAADLLGQLGGSFRVILDRSVASAIVYGNLLHEGARMLSLWRSLLPVESGVAYVWLRSSHAIASKRAGIRALNERTFHSLEDRFRFCFDTVDLPKLTLNTDDAPPDEIARLIEAFANEAGQTPQSAPRRAS